MGELNGKMECGVAWRYRGPTDASGYTKHGNGRQTYSDGSSYEGDFKEGEFEGYGVFAWGSGDSYEGMWAGGKPEGLGVMKFASGSVYRGRFRDGAMDGKGRMDLVVPSEEPEAPPTTVVKEGDWENGVYVPPADASPPPSAKGKKKK